LLWLYGLCGATSGQRPSSDCDHRHGTHVCVLQTVLELLDAGYLVQVVRCKCSQMSPGRSGQVLKCVRLKHLGVFLQPRELKIVFYCGDGL